MLDWDVRGLEHFSSGRDAISERQGACGFRFRPRSYTETQMYIHCTVDDFLHSLYCLAVEC